MIYNVTVPNDTLFTKKASERSSMTKKNFESLLSTPIFFGCDENLLRSIVDSEDCETRSFSSGETICEPFVSMKKIGIVLAGKALVLSADSDRHVLLRHFSTGDVFGVSGVFSDDPKFVSRIVAKSSCTVAFISSDGLAKLIENDRVILYNYIEFLSGRIRFLNKKIRFFTSGSAERRLALYLDSFGDDTVKLDESMSAISDMLDIGRASLYRAFDKLTEDGFIRREKDTVIIIDREKMINYYNEK